MALNAAKLKKQLMERINPTDLMQVEKLERYMKLVRLSAELDKTIKKEGASVTIENGKQRFVKSHPAVADLVKVNGMLLNIEKTFVFKESPENERNIGSLL